MFDLENPGSAWLLRFGQLLVTLLLVVVSVNVAVLVFARTVSRRGEIAVRSALGASRRRVVAQLYVEAMVLCAVAAAAGLLVSQIVLRRIESTLASVERVPYWIDLDLSASTVLYAIALAALAAVIVGVLPALKVTGGQLQSGLREMTAGSGRLSRTWKRNGADGGEPGEWYQVVGVVADFPAVSLELMSSGVGTANVYHPAAPGDIAWPLISIRFRGDVPASFIGRAREITARIDPRLQLHVRPLSEIYGSLRSAGRFVAWGLALVTSSVLVLSAAGIYAMMSFTVARRTREIGIRSALGAQPGRVLRSIFGRAFGQLSLGLFIGSALAALLFSASDLGVGRIAVLLLSVAAIMLAVGLLAALGPARRGLRIEPTEALRES